jgi:Putative auto-transporter adhesin, head GIN domain
MKRILASMSRAVRASIGLGVPLFALLALGIAHAEPSATQSRSVGAFHAIELAGTLEVEVAIGKPASVQITGDADLLDKVTTLVKDGVLVIDTPHKIARRNYRMRANVTVPDLTSIALSGTGAMKVSGIANENLAIYVPGTGSVTAAGSTRALRVTVDGTGQITAKDLASTTAAVDVSGTGQVKLRASESLEANISGTGAIEVIGKPARIKKSVTGTGSIQVR